MEYFFLHIRFTLVRGKKIVAKNVYYAKYKLHFKAFRQKNKSFL